jgi:hypothetical protein
MSFVHVGREMRPTRTESRTGSEASRSSRAELVRIDGIPLGKLTFAAFCLVVMAVSVHDAMLVVLNAQIIVEFEQNPVGRWLLQLPGGGIWLFLLVKLVGTAVACSILVTVYEQSKRLGLVAAGGVASFQVLLLGYLTLA